MSESTRLLVFVCSNTVLCGVCERPLRIARAQTPRDLALGVGTHDCKGPPKGNSGPVIRYDTGAIPFTGETAAVVEIRRPAAGGLEIHCLIGQCEWVQTWVSKPRHGPETVWLAHVMVTHAVKVRYDGESGCLART